MFKSVTFNLSAPEILEFFQHLEHLCKFCIESYGKNPTVAIRRIVYQENYTCIYLESALWQIIIRSSTIATKIEQLLLITVPNKLFWFSNCPLSSCECPS